MAFCCAQSEISAQVLKAAIQTHLSCSPFILDQGFYLSSAPLAPATLVSLLHAMAGSSLWNMFSLNIHVVNSLTFLKPLLRCHLLSETYQHFFFFFVSYSFYFRHPLKLSSILWGGVWLLTSGSLAVASSLPFPFWSLSFLAALWLFLHH